MNLEFKPTISSYCDLKQYASKLLNNSKIFTLMIDGDIASCICVYPNGYIPLIGTLKKYRKNGYIKKIFIDVEAYCFFNNIKKISLKANYDNYEAIFMYIKNGFLPSYSDDKKISFNKIIHQKLDFHKSPIDFNGKYYIKRDDYLICSKYRRCIYEMKKCISQNCDIIITASRQGSNHVKIMKKLSNLHSQKLYVIEYEKHESKININKKINDLIRFLINKKKIFCFIDNSTLSIENSYPYTLKHNEFSQISPEIIYVPVGTGNLCLGVARSLPNTMVVGVSLYRDQSYFDLLSGFENVVVDTSMINHKNKSELTKILLEKDSFFNKRKVMLWNSGKIHE
jgi:hypothetical protein